MHPAFINFPPGSRVRLKTLGIAGIIIDHFDENIDPLPRTPFSTSLATCPLDDRLFVLFDNGQKRNRRFHPYFMIEESEIELIDKGPEYIKKPASTPSKNIELCPECQTQGDYLALAYKCPKCWRVW